MRSGSQALVAVFLVSSFVIQVAGQANTRSNGGARSKAAPVEANGAKAPASEMRNAIERYTLVGVIAESQLRLDEPGRQD